MSDVLYFVTPGEFPLDSFTTFGTNSKPNTKNPIGYFGTGLKYALAIILRNGGDVTLYTKGKEYVFYLGKKNFRGKDFEQVRMKSRAVFGCDLPWNSKPLPFTSELGKNWEPWKAYRELASNTFDENGYITEEVIIDSAFSVLKVKCGEIKEAHDSSDIFPPKKQLLWSSPKFEIYEGESNCIYYRGVRVYDLRYKSRFTYNFKENYVTLSEDRTADNIWTLFYWIKEAIKTEIHDSRIVGRMIRKENEPTFEGEELSFDYETSDRLSPTFTYALGSGGNLSRSALNFFAARKEAQQSTFKAFMSFDLAELQMLKNEVMDEQLLNRFCAEYDELADKISSRDII